jgi:HJR/Mrr/RecB family endonuclease
MLEDRFNEYDLVNNHHVTITDVDRLSGVEFGTYIGRILKNYGYDVSGTPTTGDQGAGLVAERR